MVQQPPYPVSSHFRPGQGQRQPAQGAAPYEAPSYESIPYGSVSHGAVPPARSAHGRPGPLSPQAGPSPRAAGRAEAAANPRHVLMAGGSMVALAALLITPNLGQRQEAAVDSFSCIKMEQNQALISRDQIRKLVTTEPQAAKSAIQELLSTPYCVMAPAKTEAGIMADREAYPLEFDPQTWLVVLYEGDRYLGYDFRFR